MINNDNKLTIKQEPLLPGGFRFFGLLLMFIGGSLSVIQFKMLINEFEFLGILLIIVGIALVLGGLLLLTAHYRLTIDPLNKTYHIYPWLLGYVPGNPDSFNSIDKIYINHVKRGQNNHSLTGKVSTTHTSLYKAFILLDDGEKIHLDTDSNLEKLELKVDGYKQQLKKVLSA